MKYAEYGLDETKKAIDDGSAGFSYCPWCQGQQKKGFSMCFSNFCICESCVLAARIEKKRWKKDDGNGCFKCDSKKKDKKQHDLLFFDLAGSLSICADCLTWAEETLKIKVDNNSFNKNLTMAKVISKTTADHKIEMIGLSSIVPSKTNPRKSFEKENIKDLAESMKAVGLLQPITVRSKGDKYEIVAGERRYKAAQLLKWETIPSMVRNISDDEMLEIQIIENLQREDVSPLDEAHAFKTLLQKESIDWLSSKIHKSKKYIADRLKLNDLVKEAAEHVKKGILPLGHAVVISKLSYADQQACLEKCMDTSYEIGDDNLEYCKVPLEELKEFISDEIMLDLDKVNFDLEDPELYPQAGSCQKCPKRTCNSNLLFQDITKDDKCTDKACFNEKINLHIGRAKEAAKATFGKVLTGEKGVYQSSNEVKVQGIGLKYSEQPIKNGVPVVITKSDRFGKNILGTTVYVDGKQLEKSKQGKEQQKEEKQSTPYLTYEQRQIKSISDNWSRFEIMAKASKIPQVKITQEYFMDELDSRNTGAIISFAIVAGMVKGIETPEQIYQMADDDSDEFEEKRRELIKTIVESYTPGQLAAIIMMLKHWDDAEDEETEKGDYGMTWSEIVKELDQKPAKKK